MKSKGLVGGEVKKALPKQIRDTRDAHRRHRLDTNDEREGSKSPKGNSDAQDSTSKKLPQHKYQNNKQSER